MTRDAGPTLDDPGGALPSRRDVLRLGGAAAGVLALGGLRLPGAWAAPVGFAGDYDAEVPTAWFDLAVSLVRATPGYSPPVASRALAYAGLTLYEAVVPGMRGYRSLAPALPDLGALPRAGASGAHWAAVANSALAAILRPLFPTAPPAQQAAIDALESGFDSRLGASLPPGVRRRSTARGREVAWRVLAWSMDDGGHEGYLRNFPPGYAPPVGPGLWEPTPPGFVPALQPYWGWNRTFALASGADCPAGPPTPYSSDPASAFHQEALEVYDAVNGGTAEQQAIAHFWSDDPGSTPTPPGHSIAIATQALRLEGASLATAAETYAKVGMAVADAFVTCWYTKYRDNLLRPVTYLRANVDPAWLPLLVTPPFPEYTSGHSVQSGAAAQVLTDLFGEGFAFTDHTHDGRGLAPRSFASFFDAAAEAAISRLYGGIHFRPAIEIGVAQGRCVGEAVSALPFTR